MKPVHILQILSMYHEDGEEILKKNTQITKFEEFNEKEVITF